MAEYTLTSDPNAVIINKTGQRILTTNEEWYEYDKWLDAGNTPDPYVPDAASVAFNTKRNLLLADVDRKDIQARLDGATPAQIKAYVDNNVNNLADAKTLLKKILLLLSN